MWDVQKAIEAAHANVPVNQKSLGLCARYTRTAIEAGGVTLVRHTSAKDYGSSLQAVGFAVVTDTPYVAQAGDVGIVHPIPEHPDGHMAMFDGTIWISDFRQLRGLYPGQSYRTLDPGYDIWRYQKPVDGAEASAAS